MKQKLTKKNLAGKFLKSRQDERDDHIVDTIYCVVYTVFLQTFFFAHVCPFKLHIGCCQVLWHRGQLQDSLSNRIKWMHFFPVHSFSKNIFSSWALIKINIRYIVKSSACFSGALNIYPSVKYRAISNTTNCAFKKFHQAIKESLT